jgi:hypothetical protein
MHHTKVKADIGLGKVIVSLTMMGFVPCIPLSEHQPYDIVAVAKDGSTCKIQVKYAGLKKNGTIDVHFRRSWADSKGSYTKAYSEDEFDFYAIYCPEKEVVLYVANDKNCPKAIRFDKPANNQTRYIKWADNYLTIKRESSETIRHRPEMAKT